MNTRNIIQASFFWKNDKPGGLGFTFGHPGYTPFWLSRTFDGEILKKYMRETDECLGTDIVGTLLAQLEAIGKQKQEGKQVTEKQAILAALNIIWLTERGFLPNDEFNGPQYVTLETM